MTTRRGFLQAMLAAGVAPAIGHAGILMPVKAIALPPPLDMPDGWVTIEAYGDRVMPMEIGRYDSFRFIDTRRLSAFKGQILEHAMPAEVLGQGGASALQRGAFDMLKAESARLRRDPYVVFVHSDWAEDLRADGYKVDRR